MQNATTFLNLEESVELVVFVRALTLVLNFSAVFFGMELSVNTF